MPKETLISLYTTGNSLLLPILNGLIGDTLADMNNPLAIDMHFREKRSDVTVPTLNLYPRLIGRGQHIFVFLHGLMGQELLWQQVSATDDTPKYGTLLAQDLGITPLYVRYNSGLHISENGRKLSSLLEELTTVYGEAIQQITLVGYSMGGLVVRSAGYYGHKAQQNWLKKLSSIVLISVPNKGAFLAKLGFLSTFILRSIPNIPTHLTAHIMDKRSNGIKDLRHGFIVEEDWKDQAVHHPPVDLLTGVTYHIIASTIAEDEKSLIALLLGDGLVSKPSALGNSPFDQATTPSSKFVTHKVFPKINHATVLTSIKVYQYLRSLFIGLTH